MWDGISGRELVVEQDRREWKFLEIIRRNSGKDVQVD